MSRPKKILIIDDSEVLLGRMKRALTAAGFEVLTTSQIVGNARHLPTCDLVIVDFHMPGIDGSQVVASMRAVTNGMKQVCPIFLYSSDATLAADHARLGFDGAFTAKGDEVALVRQVRALFRVVDMRAARRSAAPPA